MNQQPIDAIGPQTLSTIMNGKLTFGDETMYDSLKPVDMRLSGVFTGQIVAAPTMIPNIVFHSQELGAWFLTIHSSGKIEINPRYTPDEASQHFLDVLVHKAHGFLGGLTHRMETAEDKVKRLEAELIASKKETTSVRLELLNIQSANARRLQDRA